MSNILVGTITRDDVGSHKYYNLMGKIQQIDIGKRVYKVDGLLQVENQEQVNTRMGRVHTPKLVQEKGQVWKWVSKSLTGGKDIVRYHDFQIGSLEIGDMFIEPSFVCHNTVDKVKKHSIYVVTEKMVTSKDTHGIWIDSVPLYLGFDFMTASQRQTQKGSHPDKCLVVIYEPTNREKLLRIPHIT